MNKLKNKIISAVVSAALLLSAVGTSNAISAFAADGDTSSLPANYTYKTLADFNEMVAGTSVYGQAMFDSSARSYIEETISPDGAYSGNGIKLNTTAEPSGNTNIWTEYRAQNDPNVSNNFTGATEFSFYIDLTTCGIDDFSVQLYTEERDKNLDGSDAGVTTRVTKEGSVFYTKNTDGNWVEGSVPAGSVYMHLPKNYKGFVRVPLTSLIVANSTVDTNSKFDLDKIIDISLLTVVTTQSINKPITFDQYGFGGNIADGVEAPYEKAPVYSPLPANYTYKTLADFNEMVAGTSVYGQAMFDSSARSYIEETISPDGAYSGNGIKLNTTAEPSGNTNIWTEYRAQNDPNVSNNFAGATEFSFYIDLTTCGIDDFSVQLYTEERDKNSDGSDAGVTTRVTKEGSVFYTLDAEGNWVEGSVPAGSVYMHLPKNYKGFVRVPLTSLIVANSTTDTNSKFDLDKIIDISLLTVVTTQSINKPITFDQYGFGGNIADGVKAPYDSSPSDDPSADFDENNIVVSFGAMSDLHIKADASDNDTLFANVLKKFQQLAGGSDKLDAIMIAGDLCDSAPLQETPRIKTILDANLNADNTEVIPAIGNHDAYFQSAFSNKNTFKDVFGSFVYKNPVASDTAADVIKGNYHTIINGVHFISVTGIDGDHSAENLAWLDAQLSIASQENPYMPIFVETHVPPVDTMYGSHDPESRFYSTTIGAVLEKYPQSVIFAGHTHASAFEDTSVWRGAYTAVGTGSVSDGIARDAHFVQVDKNGVMRIQTYSTSTDISQMTTKHADRILKPMSPISTPPTNEELIAAVVPKADVLDVDFADGTSKDKVSGNEAQSLGSGTQLIDNTSLNKKVASFNGNGAFGYAVSNTLYSKMANTTTLECLFKLMEAPSTGAVDILSNMQSAGQGFEYTSDHVLQYWLNINGTYVVCEAGNIEPNNWVHAVATYDNNEVKLFINGLVVDRKKVTGNITHPSDPSRVYCLGSDVSNTGSFEYPAKVLIGSAKVYSTTLNDTEVYALFSTDSNTVITIPQDAKFINVQGSGYTIPTATATDAISGNVAVTITAKDSDGIRINIRDNKFTPWKTGDYTIIYRANGFLYTKTLKVISSETANATMVLDKESASLVVGNSTILVATITPAGADSIEKWESSDASIASVDENGKVTAIKEGVAVITATSGAGKTAACTITVTNETASKPTGGIIPLTGDQYPLFILMIFGASVLLAGVLYRKRRISAQTQK